MQLHVAIIPVVSAWALFSLVISIGVVRDSGLCPRQKTAQVALVWLIPLVGGVVVLAMLGQHHSRAEMKSLVPFPFDMAGYRKPTGPA